jgi:hypothetical protein
MADVGFYALNADIQAKAGANASAVSKAVAWTDAIVHNCEAEINVSARRVFATSRANFTALPADTQALLTDCAANLAAIYVITYDMSGYTSRTEAEDIINVLRDAALRQIALLREKKDQDFLIAGA